MDRQTVSEFTDYLTEIFAEFGTIHTRRMFGGHGVYHDGVIIGLVGSDVLYLKVDPETAPIFIKHGLQQFQYPKKSPKGDKLVGMSYYQAPEEALEDPDEMREWAQLAYDAALRSRK
jgi:DNA transformation protein